MRADNLTVAVFLTLLACGAAARAQTPAQQYPHSSPPAATHAAPVPRTTDNPTGNPYDPKVMAQAQALAHELTDPQVQALADVRVNFGYIRAVRLVESDVSQASQACARDNPDMRGKIKSHYNQWQQTLDPLLFQGEKDMNQTIRSGIAGPRKEIEAYLSTVDKSASYADGKLDKHPVTTPGACRGLMELMDRTQPTLIKILTGLKWPQEAATPAPAAPPHTAQ